MANLQLYFHRGLKTARRNSTMHCTNTTIIISEYNILNKLQQLNLNSVIYTIQVTRYTVFRSFGVSVVLYILDLLLSAQIQSLDETH